MRKLYLTLLFSVFLAACASKGSTPHLITEPLTSPDNVSAYWVWKKNVQPLKYLTNEQKALFSGQTITIKAKYLIDSNGDVFNVKILEANTDVDLLPLVEKSLQKRDFQPSESNTALQPIIAMSKLEFTCD